MKPVFKERIPEYVVSPQEHKMLMSIQSISSDMFKLSEMDTNVYDNIKTFVPVRKCTIPKEWYEGLTVCGKDVPKVGCGIFCTVQALADLGEKITKNDVKDIVKIIEEKGYYIPGKGLCWRWFDNFCGRTVHWNQMIRAIEYGNPVTVLIHRTGDERNFFMNLLGVEVPNDIDNAKDIIFITSDEENDCKITLGELMEKIVTAPWIWKKVI